MKILELKKHSLFVLFFISLSIGSLQSQEMDEVTADYYTKANKFYLVKNYDLAYSNVNYVLEQYKNKELPAEVQISGEKIYFFYLNNMVESKDYTQLRTLSSTLEAIPSLKSLRVQSVLADITKMQEEDQIKQQKEEQQRIEDEIALKAEKQREDDLNLLLAQQKIREEEQAQVQRDIREQTTLDREIQAEQQQQVVAQILQAVSAQPQPDVIVQIPDDSGKSPSIAVILLITFGIIVILLLFGGLFYIILTQIKSSQADREAFNMTLARTAIGGDRDTLIALPNSSYGNSDMKLLPGEKMALPAPHSTREKEELKLLIEECKKIGIEIDHKTNRKNNSKNVAELVFKLSRYFGYNDEESMIFFAISMVYDIGFLTIDDSLMGKEVLNEDEFKIIKNHVLDGCNMVSFVDESYRDVFISAIKCHHENIDGSGYPNGLTKDDIPYIARVLHVAQTFVSLVSKRGYREILDKESALDMLKSEQGIFDQDIVKAIDDII